MIQINEYEKAQIERDKISYQSERARGQSQKEANDIYNKYRTLEQKLSQDKYDEEEKLRAYDEKKDEELKELAKPHDKKIMEYDRVMNLMDTEKLDKKLTASEVYFYDYPRDAKGEVILVQRDNCSCYPDEEIQYIEPLFWIKNDKYAKIGVYLFKNRKPVNKYSLAVIGNSIFKSGRLITLPSCYGLDIHDSYTNIRQHLRDKPSKQELIDYVNKNAETILIDFLEEHEALEEEYESVLSMVDKSWEIAYTKWKMNDYENHYRGGTETEEYKALTKKLKELQR